MSSNANVRVNVRKIKHGNQLNTPHWRCPDCDCGNYNVLSNKTNEISCKKCPWSNRDD